jgi:hypothetical protein
MRVGAILAATAVTNVVVAVAVGAAALTLTSARLLVSSSDAKTPAASTTSAHAAPISEI